MNRVIFFSILIISCDQNPVPLNSNSIDFYTDPSAEISKLSDIAENIEYIPLQNSGTCITGIRAEGEKYYVKNCSEEIECFTLDGKYLYKLSKKGSAADEYQSLANFDVSSDGELLAIGTHNAIKLYQNTDTGFVFLNTINNFNPSTFSFVPDRNKILISCQNLGNVPYVDILVTNNGDTLDKRPNYNRLRRSLFPGIFTLSIHHKYNNAVFFREPANDTIYTVNSNDKIIPHMVIDAKGHMINMKVLARTDSDEKMNERWNYLSVLKFYETERYIIGLVVFEKVESIRIYDKKLKKYSTFPANSTFIRDDISGGVNFMPFYSDGIKLYYWTTFSNLREHIAGEDFINSEVLNPEMKANLKKIAEPQFNQDNSILVVVTPFK